MAKQIDVLAVMDKANCVLSAKGVDLLADRLSLASAAVAELIEAADAYRRGGYHDPEAEFSAQYRARREGETSRLDAALARCRGEA